MDWNLPTKIAAALTAFVTIGGFAWAFGDNTGYRPWLKKEMQEFTARDFKLVMDQTQQNTLAIAKSQFDTLWGKRQFNELNFDEKVSLCKNAQILQYNVTDNDGNLVCTKDGEPVLTFNSLVK